MQKSISATLSKLGTPHICWMDGVSIYLVALAAAALAAYCAVTSLFHFIPDDSWQMTIFVKNWAIAGGLLVLAAQGGGRWQLRG